MTLLQRWHALLTAEQQQRHPGSDPREQLSALLDQMRERLMATRGRGPPIEIPDPAESRAFLSAWFRDHGYCR